jgi:hypothetical protein
VSLALLETVALATIGIESTPTTLLRPSILAIEDLAWALPEPCQSLAREILESTPAMVTIISDRISVNNGRSKALA